MKNPLESLKREFEGVFVLNTIINKKQHSIIFADSYRSKYPQKVCRNDKKENIYN
jgi:hypothetical protein